MAASITDVVDGQIYIGNLAAALDVDHRAKLGITIILSICPDYPSVSDPADTSGAQINHQVISVEDDEYEDILIHLPTACNFIQRAVDQNEKVLVHCVMGVSRSVAVVAAYLMKTRDISASTALRYLKDKRPQIHPNYGFIKQLEAFAKCGHDPNPVLPAYRSWKRIHAQDVTNYLNRMDDVATIIPDQLMLASEMPEDGQQARSLLANIGVTHMVTITPAPAAGTSLPLDGLKRRHIEIPDDDPESIMGFLPEAMTFISQALQQDGRVLVFSENEPRTCITACAYLVATERVNCSAEARTVIKTALPLASAESEAWQRRLEKLDEIAYRESLAKAVAADSTEKSPFQEVSFLPPPIAPKHGSHCPLENPAGNAFNMEEVIDALSAIQGKAPDHPLIETTFKTSVLS